MNSPGRAVPDLQLEPGRLFASPRFRRLLAGYLALSALEALAAFVLLMRISAPSKKSVLFGYSPERLLTAGGMLLAALVLAFFLYRVLHRPGASRRLGVFAASPARLNLLLALAVLIFASGWVSSLLPPYQYGRFQAYVERLRPVLFWLALFGLQTLLPLLVQRFGLDLSALRGRSRLLRAFLLALLALLLAWAVIALTRAGLTPDRNQWNDTGVPLLGLQILLAAGFGALLLLVERIARGRVPALALDAVIFAGLWLAAALLWSGAAMPSHYFAPGPYPPADQHVPFSDAEFFDLGSQTMLAGQGYNGGKFYDRALYMGFLSLLHLLAGQDYSAVAGLQVIFFALLPGLVYLLGRALHSRAAGGMAGLLAVLKELNAIAASRVLLTAHSRLFLTEFPTLIAVVLFALLLVIWLKKKPASARYALLSGAVLGFSTMLRSNPLFLLPVGWGMSFLAYWRSWRRWLAVIALFMLALTASITPWMVRNQVVAGRGFFYLTRIQDVIRARYQPDLKAAATPAPAGTPEPGSPAPTTPAKAPSSGSSAVLRFIGAHFAHNLVASVLELPLRPAYDSLDVTLKTGFPWQADWNGALPLSALPLFLLNLLLLALGAAAAWTRCQWAGLVPLAVFLAYSLSNGFARASGGRYLVPMDWAVYLYFALGAVQLILLLARLFNARPQDPPRPAETAPLPARRALPVLAGLLLAVLAFAALLPLSEGWLPVRYPFLTQAELAGRLRSSGALEQAGVSPAELDAFLRSPNTVLDYGRALYPRFYVIDQGEPDRLSPYRAFPYPRTAFRWLLPRRTAVVLLPQNAPAPALTSGADVLVLGCQAKGFTDAYAVVVFAEQPVVYLRQPAAPLACPLPAPVCDNNRNCQ